MPRSSYLVMVGIVCFCIQLHQTAYCIWIPCFIITTDLLLIIPIKSLFVIRTCGFCYPQMAIFPYRNPSNQMEDEKVFLQSSDTGQYCLNQISSPKMVDGTLWNLTAFQEEILVPIDWRVGNIKTNHEILRNRYWLSLQILISRNLFASGV